MVARVSVILIFIGCLAPAVSARVPADSLLIIASEADAQRMQRAVAELSRHAEALQRRALEVRVDRAVRAALADTLPPAGTPAAGDPAAYRRDAAAALEAMQALSRETGVAARFVAEGTRRARPADPQPPVPGMTTPQALVGRERLRQVTDLVQPLLFGSGTVIRGYSETASNVLIVGGVASAIIGYFTAPERLSPQELLPPQLRGATAADTADVPGGIAAWLPGARGINLTGHAAVDLEARQLMLDEYNRRAARLVSSLGALETGLQSLAAAWQQADGRRGELAASTADAAAQLAHLMDQTENLARAAYGLSREAGFVAEAFEQADPRTAEQFRLVRNRSRMFASAYDEDVGPGIVAQFGRARTALARLQSATLTID